LEEVELKAGLEEAMVFSAECNKYFNDRAPWKLAKEDPEQAKAVLFLGAKAAYAIAVHFQPFVPFYCQEIYNQLGLVGSVEQEIWGKLSNLKPGQTLGKPAIVYRRIEKEKIQAEITALSGNAAK
jgi:methionyl-tRNA synthetase